MVTGPHRPGRRRRFVDVDVDACVNVDGHADVDGHVDVDVDVGGHVDVDVDGHVDVDVNGHVDVDVYPFGVLAILLGTHPPTNPQIGTGIEAQQQQQQARDA